MMRALTYLLLLFLICAAVSVLAEAQEECGGTIELKQVQGRVLLPSDMGPADGATIEIIRYKDLNPYKPPKRIIARTTTDSEGYFHIEGVKPGLYWLIVERNLPANFIVALKLKSLHDKRKALSHHLEFVLGKEWHDPCSGGTIRLIPSPDL